MKSLPPTLRQRPDLWISGLFLLLWSSGFAIVKVGLQYCSPMMFLWLRYVIVVLVLLPVVLVQRPPLPRGRPLLAMIASGVLMQCVYFAGTYLAIDAGISAGLLALIVSLQPVVIGVASPLLLRTPVAGRQWLGLLLGFFGAAVVILAKSGVERFTALGMGLAWLSLLGLSASVLLEKASTPQPIILSLFSQYLLGMLLVSPLAFTFDTQPIQWNWAFVGSLGYLSFFNSLLAIALLMLLVRRNEAARVSAVFFLVPPCAALVAWLLLGEPMPWLAWGGVVLAAMGVRLCSSPAPGKPLLK
ncbi:DMT family transporter [Pseudomonas sp. CMR5c]|uniref:DMT family transporter n=1 Tax=Pseudomonas TaxID=286 RepID=UPI00069F5B8C|nr:DMT family transporter [Pseudomonas sp. CMR5c]AZC19615.1 Permease of the drug/metabolite transporter (DMT) superfamily [Pseudomonas sp. CMR5c]